MSEAKLYPYSYDPIEAVGNIRQANINPMNHHGWYRAGAFLEDMVVAVSRQGFVRQLVRSAHRVRGQDHKLSTPELAVEFTERFGVKPSRPEHGVMKIRWEDVEKQADGIRLGFKPREYLHGIDKKIDWTEAWDIPAGCIWNFSDVEVVDNDGRILPRVPVHKHWPEDRDGAESGTVSWQSGKATAFVRMDSGQAFEVKIDELGFITIPAEATQ